MSLRRPTFKVSSSQLEEIAFRTGDTITNYPDDGLMVLVTDAARFVAPLAEVASAGGAA